MRFGRGRGRHVRAAWGHGCVCGTGGRCAPAAAAACWSRVVRACSARAYDGYVVRIDRRDVREHRRHAGEPLHEQCALYPCTIESAPFTTPHSWVFHSGATTRSSTWSIPTLALFVAPAPACTELYFESLTFLFARLQGLCSFGHLPRFFLATISTALRPIRSVSLDASK